MARFYQRKHNSDGSINPQWKPDTRRRDGDRHKSRARRSGFVFWDGEGVTVDGVHRYVMLLSSAKDRHVNPEGLSTLECCEALISGAELNPRAWHVGFAFSYDVNMILRDVPRELLKPLWQGERIFWRTHEHELTITGYRLQYRPRKEFVVQRVTLDKRTRMEIDTSVTCRVWDVFGFFQSSFVKALESYGIGSPQEIKRMKAQRSNFTLRMLDRIEHYCARECELGQQLCETFAGYLGDANIKLTRFDGAGAVAAALFRDNGVKAHKAKTLGIVADAVQAAYYGGRIELVRYGHHKGDTYQYDLRSAYPAAMTEAPCLACGSWKRERVPPEIVPFALYRIRWNLRGDVLPFPWRASHGAVFFPPRGRGWYWGVELLAARELLNAGVITGEFRVLDSWRFVPGCEHAPFSWLRESYATRARWKAEGIGAEKVLKLGINSVYGKCAQRVGARGKIPSWHQMEWSGYTTARTRARLVTAAIPAIRAGTLVMFATDALFTTAELPELRISSELGDWDRERYDGITAVQSGVYWLWKGDTPKAKSRGFRPSELDVHSVLAGWRAGHEAVQSRATRFVALGRALQSADGLGQWRQWVEQERRLSLHPAGTKRELPPGVRSWGRRRVRPHLGIIRTIPTDPVYWQSRGIDSTPIALPWQRNRLNAVDTLRFSETLAAQNESDDGNA